MADSHDTKIASTIPLTSRRALVAGASQTIAGLAATPLTALPGVAGAVAGPDPIFTAIERHKAALARLGSLYELVIQPDGKRGRLIRDVDEDDYASADKAEMEALSALCDTPPTTRGGITAALEYFTGLNEPYGFVFEFLETLVKSPLLNGEALS